MAEDDVNANDLAATDDESPRTRSPETAPSSRRKRASAGEQEPKNPKCRSRIDQLAIPNRRLILALYQSHASHLPKDKVEKIKLLLQELYAMSPEETEKYFDHLRSKGKEMGRRKDIKYMLKKLVKKRKKAKQIKQAYDFINRLLRRAMEYAAKNQIPPLVSVRLRNMSNIILEQICDLRNVNIPDRDNPDQVGAFLIRVADWMAIAIEHLYYGVQLKKNRELQRIEVETKSKEKEIEKLRAEAAEKEAKTKKAEAEKPEEGVISEPLMLYEME